MNYLVIALRIIHIGAGIFWVGGALMVSFFIAPTVAAIDEAGQKFLGHLMGVMKFSQRISAAAGTTLLAGIILFWIDSQGFTSAWMKSGAGRGFSIGAGFAIIGFVFGILLGQIAKAMAKLGAEFKGKPTDDQMKQMQGLKKQQATYSMITSVSLILAVIFMAAARYFVF